MSKLIENDIEQFTIELLQSLGWDYIFGPDIAPDSENRHSQIANRQSFSNVLLFNVLKSSLMRINPDIPEDAIDDAIKQIQNINTPNLIANNELFHRMLTQGINVVYYLRQVTAEKIIEEMRPLDSLIEWEPGAKKPLWQLAEPTQFQKEVLKAFGYYIDDNWVLQPIKQ